MEGFEVAGNDKVFYPAKAEVFNNSQIKVTCDKVAQLLPYAIVSVTFSRVMWLTCVNCPCIRSVRIIGNKRILLI